MTYGQIVTLSIIAKCYWAKWSVKVGLLGVIGDPEFEEQKALLQLCYSFIETIECYNPDAVDNCLTLEEIEIIIGRILVLLGICGDPYSLAESSTDCCDPLHDATLVNP